MTAKFQSVEKFLIYCNIFYKFTVIKNFNFSFHDILEHGKNKQNL